MSETRARYRVRRKAKEPVYSGGEYYVSPPPATAEFIFAVQVATVSEANRRDHWAVRSGRAKAQRYVAYVAAVAAIRKPIRDRIRGGGRWRIVLTRFSPRRLDSDNLAGALKAVRDGIADALGINDGDPRFSWRYEQEVSIAKATRGVIVGISAEKEAP